MNVAVTDSRVICYRSGEPRYSRHGDAWMQLAVSGPYRRKRRPYRMPRVPSNQVPDVISYPIGGIFRHNGFDERSAITLTTRGVRKLTLSLSPEVLDELNKRHAAGGPSLEEREVSHGIRLAASPIENEPPIASWEDAEIFIGQWMHSRGYCDAAVTPRSSDGGVDVRAKDTVAQVKWQQGTVGRPALQRLFGVAVAEDSQGLFFASSQYSSGAVAFADGRLALFTFDSRRQVTAVNAAAKKILRLSDP